MTTSNNWGQSLLELVDDLAFAISLDGTQLFYINSAALKLFGSSSKDLQQQPGLWLERVHEADREALVSNLARMPEVAQFDQKFRITASGGEIRGVTGRFELLRDDQGQPVAVGAILKDVTDRVRAERRFQESQAIYHSLVESLPINVFRKDSQGRLLFANQGFCRSVGLPLQKLLGKTDAELYGEERGKKYAEDDAWVLKTGKVFRDIEQPPGGNTQHVETLKSPVVDSRGNRVGIQGMFWDVTDRVEAELALRKAKELAENASRAKSDFLTNVSHEIRTPMNGIIGMSELLLTFMKEGESREKVEMILESGESLLTLINEILDFSKIEAGKIRLEAERFALRECLGDTIRSFGYRAHEKQIELIMHFDPSLPQEIIADLGRLRQVVINLVGNAVKFTSEGHVFFSAQCKKQDEKSVTVEFTVLDTGIGIPEEKQESIFMEFEQADSSTTREYGGTGLGLAISSKIVRLMGGELFVQSSPDIGSRFSFELDFLKGSEPTDDVDDRAFIGKSVLVVAENQLLCESLQQRLAWHRMVVGAVVELRHAQRILLQHIDEGNPVEIIVLDGTMPAVLHWLKWLVTLDAHQRPRLILLNSTNQISTIEVPDGLEIVQQILKPVQARDLRNAFVAAVDGAVTDVTPEAPETRILSPRKKLRILLVEDNVINQKLALALLKQHGHTVTVAADGAVAVDQFDNGEFDLVLMDIQMPVMDGFEATRRMREIETSRTADTRGNGTASIPIIALTAHASSSDREKCLAAGMDEYIAKPIRAKALHQLIDQQTGQQPTDVNHGSAQPQGSGLVDWSSAFDTVGGQRELLMDLMKVFLKERDGMLASVEKASADQDVQNLRISAHSLKGALGHLGALSASELARQIEANANPDTIDFKAISPTIEKLVTTVNEVSKEFEKFVGEA